MDKGISSRPPRAAVPSGPNPVPAAPTPVAPGGEVRLRLAGDLERAAPLSVADLRAMPQRIVEAGFACGRLGEQRHVYTGPLLLDVLLAAGPRFDPVIGKDRVRFLIAVTGRDGHTAVMSWGEIDPRYGGGAALLATRVDGRAMDADGPQLVVPGDVAGGRYVSRIATIWTGPATAAGAA
ncbi:hypothetical protein [Actinomadura nitritigenes]|uniref:hypothetical protein n=1 Tax=Actinomadura nitritigenes TaxID=134602 RepID=UPI003D8FC4BA